MNIVTSYKWRPKREELRVKIFLNPRSHLFLFLWFVLRTEFNPSVSMMIKTVSSLILIGYPQIHKPFVQGIVVGPMANPVILFSNRLERNDLPVLCGPATAAIATYTIMPMQYFFIPDRIRVKHLMSTRMNFEAILNLLIVDIFVDQNERNWFSLLHFKIISYCYLINLSNLFSLYFHQ